MRDLKVGDVIRDPLGGGLVEVTHVNHTRGTLYIAILQTGRRPRLAQRLNYDPRYQLELIDRTAKPLARHASLR